MMNYMIFFDADFDGLASNAEVYIFNQDDSQNRLELILATSWFTWWYMLCKVITANSITRKLLVSINYYYMIMILYIIN